MTAATDMECLSDETLAAFVDGELDDSERAAVTEHLAVCGECRSNISEAREFSAAEKKILDKKDEPNKIVRDQPAKTDVKKGNVSPFRTKTRLFWIGGAAAAMLIVVTVSGPIQDRLFPSPGIPEVIEAAASLKVRPTLGRLTEDLAYKTPKTIYRDGASKEFDLDTVPLIQVTNKLETAKRPDLHDLGVAYVLLDKPNEAVETLEKALAQGPADRDAVEQDLAVALLQRGRKDDLERSLEISERLWQKAETPKVAWNRAYALKQLGRYEAAIAAWDDYLKLDPWVREAVTERDRLRADAEALNRNP